MSLTAVLYQRPQCATVRVWTANRTQPHIFQWSHTNYTDLVHNHWNARKYSFIIKLVIVSCNYLHRLPISVDKLCTQFFFTLVEPKFMYRSVLKLATHIEFVKRFVVIWNTIVLERRFLVLYGSNKRKRGAEVGVPVTGTSGVCGRGSCRNSSDCTATLVMWWWW